MSFSSAIRFRVRSSSPAPGLPGVQDPWQLLGSRPAE
jgi:hypothetical protein